MADPKDNKQPSFLQKVNEASRAMLDAQIMKAKSSIINANVEDDFFYSKAVVEDPSYSMHSQGWLDKPSRLQNGHLKQMSYQDSAVAAVIQTRMNQVASHSILVKNAQKKGWMIVLADEESLLAKIKEELKKEMDVANLGPEDPDAEEGDDVQQQDPSLDEIQGVTKADGDPGGGDNIGGEVPFDDQNPEDNSKTDDEVEKYNFELERKAREKLNKQFEKARRDVEQYIMNCGKTDNRPFETKKWNFDTALRAWVRDSLTYDLFATEKIPDRAGRPHHWFPVDGGTIKYASRDLKKYKDMAATFYNIDILYPERTVESKEKQEVIELDPKLLKKNAYKWVQIIRGKVERAYTEDEMGVGIRNMTTDIYNNGYGLSELELMTWLVTGHLNAEYYNQSYFTQGFSAKGILHIKAALNRRKVETVKMQWQHMLKGARNSFQTPIFAGVEDVHWIPLTQNHNDIGFEGWMRYLVTMLCAIFQIDPAEVGIHFKGEGSGGNLSGDNTKEKIQHSKDKGLYPLIKYIEGYINRHIVCQFDSRFLLKFTGIDGEDAKQALERQEKEVKFKKTVNEIRAEDGLPPLPGCDEIILDAQYIAWFNNHSDKAQQKADKGHQNTMEQLKQQGANGEGDEEGAPAVNPEEDIYGEGALHAAIDKPKAFGKSGKLKKSKPLVVEVYKIED